VTAEAAGRTRTTARHDAPTGRPAVTLARVLASEWTKTAGLGWTLWVPLATVLVAAAMPLGLGMFARPGDGTTAAGLVVSGVVLAQLGTLVLGVLVGTSDFATSTAATTYTAVPRRLPVLTAQVVLTTGLALVTSLAAIGASVLVTVAQSSRTGLTLDLAAHDGTARALAGVVLYLTAVALLGLGLGALVRRPACALVAGVALLVVADRVLAANPGRVADTVRVLLPGIGTRLVETDTRLATTEAASLGPHLGTWGAGLVLAAWVVGVLVAAGARLRRGDVT
jgi:ABC-2 type transport system permease protein